MIRLLEYEMERNVGVQGDHLPACVGAGIT